VKSPFRNVEPEDQLVDGALRPQFGVAPDEPTPSAEGDPRPENRASVSTRGFLAGRPRGPISKLVDFCGVSCGMSSLSRGSGASGEL
jgi:hypothetical protein